MPGRTEPEDPRKTSSGLVEVTTVHVSVNPRRSEVSNSHSTITEEIEPTITLPDGPVGIYSIYLLCSLFSKRCSSGKERIHAAKVVLLQHLFILGHEDDDGRNLRSRSVGNDL